jgi:hypothetical protein
MPRNLEGGRHSDLLGALRRRYQLTEAGEDEAGDAGGASGASGASGSAEKPETSSLSLSAKVDRANESSLFALAARVTGVEGLYVHASRLQRIGIRTPLSRSHWRTCDLAGCFWQLSSDR